MSFEVLRDLVKARFDQMVKTGGTLFTVEYDRDAIWLTYLDQFIPELKQEHTCNCCKAFIRQAGGVVVILEDNSLGTVWDLDTSKVPDQYLKPVEALRAYVSSRPVAGLYYHPNAMVGTEKSPDMKRNIVWTHFNVKLPRGVQGDLAPQSGTLSSGKDVLKRALEEIAPDSVDTVLELIAQNSLYRGTEYKHMLDQLKKLQAEYKTTDDSRKDRFVWRRAASLPDSIARVRNTAIGQLLQDLSEGKDLEYAVKAFETMVAPANYKRPTSLVTPRMVEAAKARLGELGLMSALERRRLDTRDLTAANALFVHRPKKAAKDVFDTLIADTPVDVKSLSKVEEIGIEAFIEKVLPTAQSVKVLFERGHLGNLVTLTGPVDPEAKSLMKWDNSFGWSYAGGVADSIKERVKVAGGRVDNVWLRASLAWYNFDDLDLHFVTGHSAKGRDNGNGHVFFGRRQSHELQTHLDLDENAGSGKTREPLENIYVAEKLKPGNYAVFVNQFCKRETSDSGFELEIEVNGEGHTFASPTSPGSGVNAELVKFTVAVDGSVSFLDCNLSKASSGVTKWGLKTGVWHQVKAVTLSPNHWTKPVGNKHYFFLLAGAMSDEKTRPFYNEFLTEDLAKDRKTTEALSGKIEVAPAEGAELSGLGFSDTMRNHVFVEVAGAFKRTLKVQF